MRTSRWKRIACAVCLSAAAACAYQAMALPPLRAQTEPALETSLDVSVLRGQRVLTFGGYELNVAFTSRGRLLCFDISAAPGVRT